MRSLFTKGGGNLAGAGSVSWLFQKKGAVLVSSKLIDEDRLMNLVLEAGAEDMTRDGDLYSIVTNPHDLERVKQALTTAEIPWESADLTMIPSSTVRVDHPSQAQQLLNLLDQLEEHDDVQHVFANFDIPDNILAAHAAA